MKYTICISRQYGSGGHFIAKKLAEKLGIAFYDKELLAKASEESGISPAIFENYDEKKDNFFSGIIPTAYGYDISMGQRVFLAQFDAIRKIAEKESCVIVGRCADYILKEEENVVSIFIHAPIEDRVLRAVKFYDINENKAKDTILKMDKKRKSYYNFYSDKQWGKSDSYDLSISSSIGIDETVDVIAAYIKKKLNLE